VWLLAVMLVADTVRAFPVAVSPAESITVTVAGTGDPVVLVPGLFGSAFGYRRLIPLLTDAGYRAIVVEPLAIGTSARPEHADYSLTAQADRIAAALDRLGVSGAIVVAHSLGASMAYRLAYRRPDLVVGIVSIDGGPAERATTRGFRRAMELAPWIKLFGGVKLVRKTIRGQLIKASGDTSWVSDAVVEGYTAGATRDLDATLKAFLTMARRREPEPLRPHLTEVRCPVRLLVGTGLHEGGVGPGEVAALAGTLPEFTVDSMPGAGHFIHEERPDAVLAAVRRLRAP
jgi:pimeloyl-ACP methyl ester carboxylesterase